MWCVVAWVALVGAGERSVAEAAELERATQVLQRFRPAVERIEDLALDLELPHDDRLERRVGLLADLRQRVRAAEDVVLDASLVVLREGTQPDRRLAQVLLAQLPELPPRAHASLAGSPHLDAWALSMLRLRRRSDYLVDRAEAPRAFVDRKEVARHVAPQLVARLRVPEAELEGFEPDYVEHYREVVEPLFARYAEVLATKPQRALDLDGDGVLEVLLIDDFGSAFFDDLGYLALVRRRGSTWTVDGMERLRSLERFEDVLVRDFDRDGLPEVAVRTWSTQGAGTLRMVGAATGWPPPILFAEDAVRRVVLLERHPDEPTRCVSSRAHAEAFGGACRGAGSPAFERELFVWRDGAFVSTGSVFEPYRW